MSLKTFLLACFVFTGVQIQAQPQPTVVASKVDILIGEQFKLTLSARFASNGFNAYGFAIPDSIDHFEVIEKGPLDSSLIDGIKSLTQTLTLTSFDSGVWAIPPISLLTRSPSGKSDSILIKVGYDPTPIESIHDIKDIVDTAVNATWIYWFVGILTLLAMVGFIVSLYFTRLRNDKKEVEEILAVDTPPLQEALEALQKLASINIRQKEEAKQVHSELSQVFKRYLLRAHQINTLKNTSDEILVKLKDALIAQSQLAALAEVLRLNDAVKFAGYFPVGEETQKAIQQTEQLIQLLHKNKQV
jgi:hypothetical protein